MKPETKNLQALCSELFLPEEVTEKVLFQAEQIDWEAIEDLIGGLLSPPTAEQTYQDLSKIFQDEKHFDFLAIELECARRSKAGYREKGIGKEIYFATMACFKRTLSETFEKTGRYSYDTAWWFYRQANMSLFRLGALEFEMSAGAKSVSVHIPSDAAFDSDSVSASIAESRKFFCKYYPDYADAPYYCWSWLLSPRLTPLLSETSHILSFQRRFTLTEDHPEDNGFYGFLFGADPATPVEKLKEKTGLQKSVKALLKAGVNLGAAVGVLKTEE